MTSPGGRTTVRIAAHTVIAARGTVIAVMLLSGDDRPGAGAVGVGQEAPPMDLPDVRPDRPRVVLAELRGKAAVVNFWATWCTPCRREMPLLADAHRRLGDRMAIVGVDVKDNRDEAIRFLGELGVDYPSAYDPEASAAASFDIVGLPVTVLVGADGRVLDRITGELTARRLDRLLGAARAATGAAAE
jgi:cytochrome c biogenesis protein CcmG/thiol:disulfide interchange protein DsbE